MMKKIIYQTMAVPGIVVFMTVLLFLPWLSSAQEEMASAFRRYKAYEVSTGYYEEYEAVPRHKRAMVNIPGVTQDILLYSPSAAKVRIRSRLSDSHTGIKFYETRRCEDCHTREAKNIHTVRGNITCRQCHGGEPISGIRHYFSPMNPIRKHAYICAKCHEGASASFSNYLIHPPNPALFSTQKSFPILFYVFWFMVAIAVGTFVVFLPHTLMWGIRELFIRKRKQDNLDLQGKVIGESDGKNPD